MTSGHHLVRLLLLSVQRRLQNEFCKLTAVVTRLNVQHEVLIGAQQVRAERVRAHIQVLRALQREPGARRSRLCDLQIKLAPWETGSVIIHVQDLHFYPIQFQRVLDDHLQVQETNETLFTQLLAVDLLVHKQNSLRIQSGISVRTIWPHPSPSPLRYFQRKPRAPTPRELNSESAPKPGPVRTHTGADTQPALSTSIASSEASGPSS
uniref:Uncharacterized protein n=1 Tax=Sinocyclocheilus rhinocerous TaxID=307959 RepID=A0A673KZ47_9TELE